jgi:hypothetical protein
MKMMNNYLVCEIPKEEEKENSGFAVKNLDSFKKLKVIHSEEQDIPVGCTVRLATNAGLVDEDGLVIKRGDVINIV